MTHIHVIGATVLLGALWLPNGGHDETKNRGKFVSCLYPLTGLTD